MGFISYGELKKLGILGMNRRNVRFISQYNERRRYPLVDDKLKTKLILQKASVAVPELLKVVSTQHEIEHTEDMLRSLPAFVIKPAQGSGGKGILVIIAQRDGSFIKSNGNAVSFEDAKRHMTNIISGLHSLGGRADVAIIEALVHISPIFERYSYEGVPDIRIIVFKGYPVMGMLRLATRQSDGKANLHQGAVGVGLDIGTGRAVAAVQQNRRVTHHPDTDALLSEIVVPNWRQLMLLAARCYDVTHLGYLGCDIVIDLNRGPLLLELNARPGLSIQIANNQGLLPRLYDIEALDEFAASVESRVDYSMAKFTHQAAREQTSLWDSDEQTRIGQVDLETG
ncbi:MAG: alpha-L-glutamate ligase-like protein [Proteobacteria bacterium]|nr:alpha-L-glutamate ligase-like protein [Pseudomonadota bacterium]